MVAAMVALAVTGAAGAAELAHNQITATANVNATSGASADQIIAGSAVAYDGSTKVKAEFFAPSVTVTSGGYVICELWDSGTRGGRMAYISNGGSGTTGVPITASMIFTPSAATHTYNVRCFKSGTVDVIAGDGSSATDPPAYLRITTESAGGGGASALDDLTDVDLTGYGDGDVLKYSTADTAWIAGSDAVGEGGSGGTVTLSSGDRERLDLNWWGVWAIVGLLLVLMIAPQLMSVMRVTRGMADGRG